MSYVVWFDEFDPGLAPRLGGKCAAPGRADAAGLAVPPGFAVTTDAYRAACGPLTDRLRVLLAAAAGDPAGVARTSATMRDLVEGAPLPDEVRDAVAGAYAELCGRCGTADVPVAVRSSAVWEDAPDASFAGEHDTYLWVRGAAEVAGARCGGAGRACSPSGRSPTGAAAAGDRRHGAAMGVAVQQMVLAAGRRGGLHPQPAERRPVARSPSTRPGASARPWWAARSPRTTSWSTRSWCEITRRAVSAKAVEYRLAADGRGDRAGSRCPPSGSAVPCLSDDEITAVARLARRAEQHYGCPQDVEWAIEAGAGRRAPACSCCRAAPRRCGAGARSAPRSCDGGPDHG